MIISCVGSFSFIDKLSWKPKIDAARNIQGGVATEEELILLGLEAKARGVTVEQLACVIINKAKKYAQLIGIVGGWSGNTKTLIKACETQKEVKNTVNKALNKYNEIEQEIIKFYEQ